uniref:Septin-type G domain-containing protein n=1 Tax=Mandrillus leucophaeus TaxID=9568 RepID=A0A2K6ADB3_MANLE
TKQLPTIPYVSHLTQKGEPGLGKLTLINSLLLTDLYSPEYPGPSHIIKKNVQNVAFRCCLIAGSLLSITLIVNAESRQMPDSKLMKRMHEKVIIIPLIAKADTLTPEECQQFKKQIMKEIQEHKIKIYELPQTDDDEENKLVKKVKDRSSLAVVGSNTIIEVNGKRYPWGVAEVENGEHCDFTILRNMLIRTHTQNLKDVTNNVHYERYRSKKLAPVTYNGVNNNKNKGQLTKSPLAQMEERRDGAKMKKIEMEMEQVFEMKDSEAELQRRHEQMKKNLEAQHKELEEKHRQFEDEKANWEAQQRISEQQNSLRTLEKNNKKGKIF